MQADEKIYFRETLGVKCSSFGIANSYLDGRVDKKELFSINGEKITFADIFSQDEIVRGIIRAHGDPKELFPEQHKFDDFSERYKLFKKIVLRGDDSLAPLLVDLDEQKDQISKLLEEQQNDRTQLSCWKKNNEDLVTACKNAFQALQSFGTIVEAQKRNLDPKADLFIRYSDILAIIKLLTDALAQNLQSNIVSATVSDMSADRQTIEYANAIDDFREKTEGVLAKRKADLDALVVSTKQELNTLREDTNKKIKTDLDALELHKKTEYQAIADARAQLNLEMNNLITQMSAAGEFEERIRSDAKIIFSKLNTCERCYVYPKIPQTALYSSIRICDESVAPKSVLAIFDCSPIKNGSAGMMVSTHAFYLFNGTIKKKYQLHRNNKITTEFKKSGWRMFWIIIGIASLVLARSTSGITLFGLPSFLFAFFCRSGDFTVKYRDQAVVTFPGRNAEGFKTFCAAVSQLCSSCTLTQEQIDKIEKMDLEHGNF